MSRAAKNPVPSSEEARRRMRSVRQRDTAPEKALRSSLHRLGLRFRIQVAPLKGLRRRADVVFRRQKVAVYIDGCFWHGCPTHGTMARANADFWQRKIGDNRRRDLDTNERLRAAGWTVVRIWEHEDPAAAAGRIYSIVARQRSGA